MGKRKSSAKPPPKKRMEKLPTVFSCPFCNHESSVECTMHQNECWCNRKAALCNCNLFECLRDRKHLIGEVICRICEERFSTQIDILSDPIDVYSDWIDECERANNPT